MVRHNPAQERNLIHQGLLCVLRNLWINLKLYLTFLRDSLSIQGIIIIPEPPSIVEDLGHTPCAMSALEVLQICPSQRKVLLSSLGVNDDDSSSMIKFETAELQPCLSYYVSLLIHVECLNMTIKSTMIDKGVAASVMSLSC